MSRESVHHFICDYYADGPAAALALLPPSLLLSTQNQKETPFPFIRSAHAHRSSFVAQTTRFAFQAFPYFGGTNFGEMRRTIFMAAIISIHSFIPSFVHSAAAVDWRASSSAVILSL